MQKTVLLSIPLEELQVLIIDCVNSCLRANQQSAKEVFAEKVNKKASVKKKDNKEVCHA